MGKVGGKFVIILNIDKVLSVEEIALLTSTTEPPGNSATQGNLSA
jgi:purine-binding chemotaxis protein CheW